MAFYMHNHPSTYRSSISHQMLSCSTQSTPNMPAALWPCKKVDSLLEKKRDKTRAKAVFIGTSVLIYNMHPLLHPNITKKNPLHLPRYMMATNTSIYSLVTVELLHLFIPLWILLSLENLNVISLPWRCNSTDPCKTCTCHALASHSFYKLAKSFIELL